MLNRPFKCPVCEQKMNVVSVGDGLKMLKCTSCGSEIHFTRWNVQEKVVRGK